MASEQGFDGIEGQVPADAGLRHDFVGLLNHFQLEFIAEVCTAGSYVPDRTATLQQHLDDLHRQLGVVAQVRPLKVNCIGGCDRWDIQTSQEFFQSALEIADKFDLTISFETHRGRSLYSPWVTEQLLEKMSLPLTCDFSHWCVVCEGLGETEDDLIRNVAMHAEHIHARIGYDQGPQVSDPRSYLYQQDQQKHLRWWGWIWQAQAARQLPVSTLTPEFGPDGYQMIDPSTGEAVGNLDEINHWMAQTASKAFEYIPGEKR